MKLAVLFLIISLFFIEATNPVYAEECDDLAYQEGVMIFRKDGRAIIASEERGIIWNFNKDDLPLELRKKLRGKINRAPIKIMISGGYIDYRFLNESDQEIFEDIRSKFYGE